MTRPAYNTERMTKFSLWCRTNLKDSKDGLILTNIDYIFADYKKKEIMMVEEKTHGATEIHYGQSQIFKFVDFALMNTANLDNIGGWSYKGFYIVSFSKQDPDDSDRILINHIPVTKEQLTQFLNFDISFYDLKK